MKTLKLTDAECDDIREAILSHMDCLASARRSSLGLGISIKEFDKEIAIYSDLLKKI